MAVDYDAMKRMVESKHYGVDDEYVQSYNDEPYINVKFQTSGTADSPKNGAFIEDLLIIALARLNEFNKDMPSRENSLAITKIEEAVMWLSYRKEERDFRGVYGTDKA